MYFYSFCCMSISQRRVCCSIILANVQKTVWEVTNVQIPVISLKYNYNIKTMDIKCKTFKTQFRHTSNTQIKVHEPNQESERSYFCVSKVYIVPISTCLLDLIFCPDSVVFFPTCFVVFHFIRCYSCWMCLYCILCGFLIKHGTCYFMCVG